jgi:hypothetical protein
MNLSTNSSTLSFHELIISFRCRSLTWDKSSLVDVVVVISLLLLLPTTTPESALLVSTAKLLEEAAAVNPPKVPIVVALLVVPVLLQLPKAAPENELLVVDPSNVVGAENGVLELENNKGAETLAELLVEDIPPMDHPEDAAGVEVADVVTGNETEAEKLENELLLLLGEANDGKLATLLDMDVLPNENKLDWELGARIVFAAAEEKEKAPPVLATV